MNIMTTDYAQSDYESIYDRIIELDESLWDLLPLELISGDDIEEKVSYIMMWEHFHETLGTLTEKEQRVLELRYGLKDGEAKTLEDIGNTLNITRERARRLEPKALKKVKVLCRKYSGSFSVI